MEQQFLKTMQAVLNFFRGGPTPSHQEGPAEEPEVAGGDTNRYERVYETTPHRFPARLLSSVPSPPTPASLRREDIFPDGSAFILHHLLSPEECCEVRKAAEKAGLTDLRASYRRCTRMSAIGHEFAAILFERAKPFLGGRIEYDKETGTCAQQGISGQGLRHSGTYVPIGLNPCFRVVRYAPGGFFLPHRDGGFEASESVTSIKTFMMYLNEDFTGGPTCFYTEDQALYKEPDPVQVLYQYQPREGSCLVFNSALKHDGGVVTSGNKWLLRSEVMYQREQS